MPMVPTQKQKPEEEYRLKNSMTFDHKVQVEIFSHE